jgi:hypothetical protein
MGGIQYPLFVRFRPIRKFSGFPISYYVYFQEFMLIFKGILLQMKKENVEKVQTFTILRIAGKLGAVQCVS